MHGVLRAKEAYADWIVGFKDQLHIYATFTFPYSNSWSSRPKSRQPGRLKLYRHISPETALRRGRRLRRLVNVLCCGLRFRERKTGILSVIAVEMKDDRPHLHTLWEEHPLITPSCLRAKWQEVLGRWCNAIDTETIKDVVKVVRYITKYLTWETTPCLEVWVPKRHWKEEMLTLRGVRNQLGGLDEESMFIRSKKTTLGEPLIQAGVVERCSVNGL